MYTHIRNCRFENILSRSLALSLALSLSLSLHFCIKICIELSHVTWEND